MTPLNPIFRRPRWIFFDLDDTIWDFSSNSLKSLRFIFETTPEVQQAFPSLDAFLDEYHIHNAKMWEDFAAGLVTSDFIKTERWRLTLWPESDPDNTPARCSEINDAYLSKLASLPYPMPGALELLGKLQKKYMIGALSNGFPDTQYKKLFNSGLSRYVARIIVSGECGYQKPDRRIFDYAVAETGAHGVPVLVGDNAKTDILGALKAGWYAVWFTRDGADFPYSKDFMIENGIDPTLFLGTARSMAEVEPLLLLLDD